MLSFSPSRWSLTAADLCADQSSRTTLSSCKHESDPFQMLSRWRTHPIWDNLLTHLANANNSSSPENKDDDPTSSAETPWKGVSFYPT